MRNWFVLLILLLTLAACAAEAPGPASTDPGVERPSEVTVAVDAPTTVVPMGDFFYSLPNYSTGETVTLDAFTATVTEVTLQGSQLQISVDLLNESGQPIDMVWAVQLIRDEFGYIAPLDSPVQDMIVGEGVPAERVDLGGVWTYDLAPGDLSSNAAIDLDDYRLLFVPRGWSGPVFVFRLTPSSG
ncbi:hypothetical protein [Promineifilum sp.]|uniref:hypothetical protein n=1 Tax=Promineifilum sp. TaxID=2664178 RepID=UPI0035AF73A6